MFILMVNGEIALPFTEAKTYDLGTGYIALYEPSEECCILCKYLDNEQKEFFDKPHYLFDCNNEALTNVTANRLGKEVIIITNKAKSFETTDEIIESHKKALLMAEEINEQN